MIALGWNLGLSNFVDRSYWRAEWRSLALGRKGVVFNNKRLLKKRCAAEAHGDGTGDSTGSP